MKTRKQYINHECTHREYNAQFVTKDIRQRVLLYIGMKDLLESTDEHLNDIPLKQWDGILSPFPKSIGDKMRAAGDFPSLAGAVCICKEAARQIIEGP